MLSGKNRTEKLQVSAAFDKARNALTNLLIYKSKYLMLSRKYCPSKFCFILRIIAGISIFKCTKLLYFDAGLFLLRRIQDAGYSQRLHS